MIVDSKERFDLLGHTFEKMQELSVFPDTKISQGLAPLFVTLKWHLFVFLLNDQNGAPKPIAK